jgi:GTP-binding protein
VVLAVNKADEPVHDDDIHEFWRLGFDTVLGVSAEHGRGVYELLEAVFARLPTVEAPAEAEPEDEREIRVSVLGRPNIGKSTLLNRLLGEDRFVVHDLPGTTMDATDTALEWEGTRFRLVDTAGIRRKARIGDRLESIAVSAAIRAIERCHVVLLVIDGAEGVTDQDAHLAALVEERGRGVVLLINKWDRVRELEDRNVRVVDDEIARRLPHLLWAPVLYISALTGKGCGRILSVVREVFGQFNQRIATARLNTFLREAVAAYQPPQLHHHPVRLNYMTQVRVRPPTFTLFCNTPDGLGDGYIRYLRNRMREQFGFMGSPLRLQLRRKRRLGEARPEDLTGLGRIPVDDAALGDESAGGEDERDGGELDGRELDGDELDGDELDREDLDEEELGDELGEEPESEEPGDDGPGGQAPGEQATEPDEAK